MKRFIVLIFILLMYTSSYAATYEASNNDAMPTVLYGKTSSGAIAPILVGSDGSVFGGSDGITFSGASGERLSGSNANKYIDFNDETQVSIGGGLYLRDNNVWYLTALSDLETEISKASSGDVFYLAAGTYTITDDIDLSKNVSIIGSGVDSTIISITAGNKNAVDITSQSITIRDLSINYAKTGSTTTDANKSINYVPTTAGGTFRFENIKITNNGIGVNRCMAITNAFGYIRNFDCTVDTAAQDSYGIFLSANSSSTSAGVVDILNPKITATTTSSGSGDVIYGIHIAESSATFDLTVNIFNPSISASETSGTAGTARAINTSGDNIKLNVYGGRLSGGDADIVQASSSVVTLYGTTLANNTTSGTISTTGQVRFNDLQADDYFSGDGSQGVTVTTCTAFKDGLCTSGT